MYPTLQFELSFPIILMQHHSSFVTLDETLVESMLSYVKVGCMFDGWADGQAFPPFAR